ncbi:MAG: plasmid stabilization protein [Betaproteobacteria bacterium]
MSYSLVFTEQYARRARRFLHRHPELRDAYLTALVTIENDPRHPSLHIQALDDRLAGLHSVFVDSSQRTTLQLIISDRDIIPVNVDDRDSVL